jgi:4-hydroxythreonine-4-phosphate dehydrogenase
MDTPVLAITLGDPAGIGPEIVAGAWGRADLSAWCRALVVGHPGVLRRAVRLLKLDLDVIEVSSPDEIAPGRGVIPCLAAGSDEAQCIRSATIDPRGGRAAYDAVLWATELALTGRVDAVVTGPLNKAALHAAGYPYPGHTELLAELCGVRDFAMMLYLAPGGRVKGRVGLGVVHATLHLPLREVFTRLSSDAILSRARLADQTVRRLLRAQGIDDTPRIGVCALNPHAGESGLFGGEEREIVAPAVARGIAEGLHLEGPLPADTLLAAAVDGVYDSVVALYHDQGHIALKLLDMHRAVNVTLGLPIIRTSVAHGTAFDLAWQGRAEISGMVEAVRVAAHLAQHRLATGEAAALAMDAPGDGSRSEDSV